MTEAEKKRRQRQLKEDQENMETYRTAYAEGFNAAENGVKPDCCPYPKGHKYRIWWTTGYSRFHSDGLRKSSVPYDAYYY